MRGLVSSEERGRALPGWFYRYVYGRAVLPLMLRMFQKYQSPPGR